MACIELQTEGVTVIASFGIPFSFYQVTLMGYENSCNVTIQMEKEGKRETYILNGNCF